MPDGKPCEPIEQQIPAQSAAGPSSVDNLNRANTEQLSQTNQKSPVQALEDRIKRAERWMIVLTTIIAVCAVAAVVVSALQWNVMSGQLEEMKTQEEQPYISPESLTSENFPDGPAPALLLSLHNYGKDIATQISGNISISINNTPIDWSVGFLPVLDNPPPDPKGNFALSTIPSNASRVRWVALVCESAWLQHRDSVKAGTEYLYVWGHVDYSTKDGKRLPVQNFCFVYHSDKPKNTLSPFDLCEVR